MVKDIDIYHFSVQHVMQCIVLNLRRSSINNLDDQDGLLQENEVLVWFRIFLMLATSSQKCHKFMVIIMQIIFDLFYSIFVNELSLNFSNS